MVTIKEVAQRAGVSITTVSRVLNNPGYSISPATKERVLQAVAELDYRPNALARGLLKKGISAIGLVVPDISNPYYPEVVRGVEDVASRLGYTVILCNTDRDIDKVRRYVRVLLEKRVDGIIFAGGGIEGSDDDFLRPDLKVVLIGRHGLDLPSVQVNNVKAAFQATEHLIELGHRRIAAITGPEASTTSLDRLMGYKKALKEYNLPVDGSLIQKGNFRPEAGYQATKNLLSIEERPTAIVTANDQMALGAIRAIREAGLQVPGDISVAGFDDVCVASYFDPPLTTVSVPMYSMGVRSMEMLARLIANEKEKRRVVLETKLVIRQSTGPRYRREG
ncbi:MAG: LacI family transcriptional regulator [Firmicutes bacterium]|nr:LacI family transcriptional regulator [Bacillota bacterium]MCL5040335.1 LacI family transcriptional regulator [Bacillota bacterium]